MQLAFAFAIFFLGCPANAFADDEEGELLFDEISVFVNVQGVGGIELPALIKGQSVYLSVTEIFDFLKIKNSSNAEKQSISGFLIDQKATYLIDNLNSRVVYQEEIFKLEKDDIIRSDASLYLKANVFGKIFGLNCIFSFRNLSVDLNTKLELPVLRELRQETMRQNISILKGMVKADTVVKRDYPLFNLGMADWSVVTSSQTLSGNDTRLNLNLGAIIAGGETNVSLNYGSREPFSERQQYYLWRFANNDNRFLKQTLAGKIFSQSTSSIFAPIVGLQFSNTPTTFRKSFGTYNLNDKTEPGWMVELYVNNVLVDYKKADPAGFYTFEVPLVYGNSEVKLRFYGPFGEERSSEQNISIPFNFLPEKEFEYNVSAGIVEDGLNSQYARAAVNYGLNKMITIGGGLEYLSSISNRKDIPFINTSLRLSPNLLVSSQYDLGVRFKNILTYRLPGNMQLEGNYIRYAKGQLAIINNYLEERKLMLSMPVRAAGLSFYSRMAFGQVVLPGINYSTAEWLVSSVIKGVSTTINTYALMNNFTRPYVYSNLSLALRIPAGIIFTPQAQYNYQQNELISMRLGLEKHVIKHGFLNLNYEANFKSLISNISLGFRYDFSFAQASFVSRTGNNGSYMLQSARGSLIYDQKTKYLGVNNRSSVGRGGLIISCFLDVNGNGKRDHNETKVSGLKLRINGGRTENNIRDTTLRVSDLEPYTNYVIELDPNSLDNISWRLTKKSVKVSINPNQLKSIEMPVSVVGELSGVVYLKEKESLKGFGRVKVFIYNARKDLIARTLSESDGNFSYLGLPTGNYTAEIDTAQLNKLGLISSPSTITFQILNSNEGDVVDSRDFILTDTKPVLVDVVVKTYYKFEQADKFIEKASGKITEPRKRENNLKPNLLQKRNYIPSIPSGRRENQVFSPKAESLKIDLPGRPNVGFRTNLFDNSIPYFNSRITLVNGVWVYVIYSYRAYR